MVERFTREWNEAPFKGAKNADQILAEAVRKTQADSGAWSSRPMAIAVRIDRPRCIGAGKCIAIAPTVFDWLTGDFAKASARLRKRGRGGRPRGGAGVPHGGH